VTSFVMSPRFACGPPPAAAWIAWAHFFACARKPSFQAAVPQRKQTEDPVAAGRELTGGSAIGSGSVDLDQLGLGGRVELGGPGQPVVRLEGEDGEVLVGVRRVPQVQEPAHGTRVRVHGPEVERELAGHQALRVRWSVGDLDLLRALRNLDLDDPGL